MSTELVTLTINGREVCVPKGTLVVEAARQVGIDIPVFCYHPKLKPVGACRMCLVTIEKMPRLQTACTSPVAEGMVVHSNTPDVQAAQNGVIELLLANHPLDCPICDKGGECPLQDNTFNYGRGASRFTEDKTSKDKAFPLSDRIVLDKERCILCYRCTRFQAEIPGDEAIVAIDRGGTSEVGVLEGETFDSIFSGNTIELCPVGALTSRQYRFRARPWDLRRTSSTCTGCAVGCNVSIHSRDARVLRLVSRENKAVDDGWLCDYGRFGTMPPAHEKRASEPLIRRGAALEPVSLDEALARAAELMAMPGADAVLSPSLSNEAIWLFADVLRPRLAADAAVGLFPRVVGAWPLRGSIVDLPGSKSIVLAGLDAWEELPVLALWIRRAVGLGAKLVVIGAANGLYRDTAAWLKIESGDEVSVLRGLVARLESGDDVSPEMSAAADLMSGRPSTLLAGSHLVDDPETLALLERLGRDIGAGEGGGLIGSPALAANGRGALELAASLALSDPLRADGPFDQRDALRPLLLIGQERWPDLGAARLIVASHSLPERMDTLEVLIPMAHPYEQIGSITNLEGRVQQLNPGGGAPPQARMDWEIVARLAERMGASAPPPDIFQVRAALAAAHPRFGAALSGGLPPQGRLLPSLAGVGAGRSDA